MAKQTRKKPSVRKSASDVQRPKPSGLVKKMEDVEIIGITGGPLVAMQAPSSLRLKVGDILRVQSVKKGEYQFERLLRRSLDKPFLRPLDDMIEDEWD